MYRHEEEIQELLQQDLDTFSDNRLNLLSKLAQRSVHEAISGIRPYSSLKGPYVVEIDPTTACNLACPECISGSLLNQGGLAAEKLFGLIDDLIEMGTKAVIFIGGGEPMAHPAFSQLLWRAFEGGLQIGVTTNGTLIDRHLEALAKCVAWTRVSVDAGTPVTFQVFRPSLGNRHPFESVVRQMEALARVKTGKLGYSFLLLKRGSITNICEIAKATRMAREIGCDYIEIKPSMNLDHALIRWSDEEIQCIEAEIDECRALETTTFRVIIPITLFRVLHDSASLDQPKQYHWCPATHFRTVVTPSGCYVCPYHRGNGTKKYGDLETQSFKDIWNSQEFRHVLRETDPSQDCQFHCIRHGQNQHVIQLIEKLPDRGVSEIHLVDDFDPFI